MIQPGTCQAMNAANQPNRKSMQPSTNAPKEDRQKNAYNAVATSRDEQISQLIEEGLNSVAIGRELGVSDGAIRKTTSWITRSTKRNTAAKITPKKTRRKYGSISVPRAKADVLKNLKESGARLKNELMQSPNSYQCNYFLIKREAETICALLERFFTED